ncbi:apolipoprotein N-acyltransferase [Martelella soudanensis]|uniref:apolipoprotein N-acyltransferase n=1 Tax=unclassified Martelella TaxID=2629616 RepID=UPI0015E05AA3|nr:MULTISPECIES: apolipoprotein N-acyltransferase [unclassified Martelella]
MTGGADPPEGTASLQRLSAYLADLSGWPRRWTLFGAGAVATFALAPFGLAPVMFIALPLLVMVMDGALSGKSLRARAMAGFGACWWFGFGYFVFGLWWLGVAIWKDGAFWALPLTVLAFPAGLALFYGLAGALAALVWRPGPLRLIALGAAMVVAEWLRGHVATGFPWNAIAYTAMPTPLFMQAIRLTGLYLMGGFAVYIFASPALLAARPGRRAGLALALVLVAVDIGYGWHRLGTDLPEGERGLRFRLVQPAFAEADWSTEEGRNRVFATLLELSSAPPEQAGWAPDIIIWPESVLPFTLESRPDARTAIGEMLKPGQTLVLGAASFAGRKPDGWPEFYNAVYALDDAGATVSVSGKTHLVPFGEYLPFEDFFRSIGLEALTTLPGSYVPVDNRQMLLLPDGVTLYPLICYEAVFPRLVEGQAAGASALVNVTYDAWFGRTPGPFQHFAQARLRAVETGKPLIRVGENGVTAMVDQYGRIVDRLPFDRRAVLDGSVNLH